MLALVVNVLVATFADEPPVPTGVVVPRANTAEILLACVALIFARHGLAVPGVPSCGHPVQLATMPICAAKVGHLLVKSEAPPVFHTKADRTLNRGPASDLEVITVWSAGARY
jgi:hypothetical protein